MEAKIKLDSQIPNLNNGNEESQHIVDEKIQIQESKNLELESFNRALDEKIISLKRIQNENDDLFAVMNFEIVKLKEIINKLENENVKEKISIIAELKQVIQEKDKEIELKIDKINRLKSNPEKVNQPNIIQGKSQLIEDLENQSQTLNALNLKLQSELEIEKKHMEEKKNMMISEKEKMQKFRENLEKLNSHLEIEITELKEIINAKDSEMNDLRNLNLDDKLDKVAQTPIQRDDESMKLSLVNQEITELKCQVINKDEEIKNLVEKTTELQDTITFSEQTKTNLENELKMYESNMKDLNKNLVKLDEKIEQLNADKIQLKTELCSAISSSANASDNLLEYNKKLKSLNEEISQLKELMFQADILNKNTKQQLSEKNDTIELCKKQIDSLKLEDLFLKQNYEQLTKNLSASENEFTKLTSKFEEMENSHQNHISQLEIQIKSLEDELRSLNNAKHTLEIEQASLRELNDRYSLKINNISQLNADLEKRIENLTNNKETVFAQNASIISKSQEELKTCWNKYEISEKDIDILNNKNLTPKELLDSETATQKLTEKIEKQSNVAEEHSDEKNLLLGNENKVLSDKINVEQKKIQELENISGNSSYKEQSSTNSEMLTQSKIGENDILLTKTKEEIESVQSECQKLESVILVRDSTIEKLTKQLETCKNENTNLLIKKIQFEKEIAFTDAQNDKLNDVKMKLEIDSKKSKDTIQEYIIKIKDMEQQINNLHENQFQLKEVKRELGERLYKYERKTDNQHKHGITDERNFEKTLADNEIYKGQIEFLNSVIVDMQRKNEKLLCKIEVLEMGVPATEADDYSKSTLDKRAATLRTFCDICDQFDLHDTEECPMQSEDHMSEEASMKLKMPKATVERPYCENCESEFKIFTSFSNY